MKITLRLEHKGEEFGKAIVISDRDIKDMTKESLALAIIDSIGDLKQSLLLRVNNEIDRWHD